jgi:hypothetical protein
MPLTQHPNQWKCSGVAGQHPRGIKENPLTALHAIPDCACDNIARRQICRGMNVGHKAPAGLIDEDPAGTAQRLGDQWHRVGIAVQRSRMELYELQPSASGSRVQGHSQSIATSRGRIRRMQIELTDSPGSQHRIARLE